MRKIVEINSSNVLSELRKELMNTSIRDIVSTALDTDLVILAAYLTSKERCNTCNSIKSCTQGTPGYQPELDTSRIEVLYLPCKYKEEQLKQSKSDNLIESLYVPKNVLNAKLRDFRVNTSLREIAFAKANGFVDSYLPGMPLKSLYLVGKYGAGKTFLLSAIANELKLKGCSSIIVYLPDLARSMKSSIGDGTMEQKVRKLKEVDILLLDDIGSEMNGTWFRDEILGPILQHRVLSNLPTFFSSNLSLKELAIHFSDSKTEDDKVKAARIAKRIYDLAEVVELDN